MTNRTYAGGGQPAEYWALPFDKRHTFHAMPGVKTRDISHIGLEGDKTRRQEGSGSSEAAEKKKEQT